MMTCVIFVEMAPTRSALFRVEVNEESNKENDKAPIKEKQIRDTDEAAEYQISLAVKPGREHCLLNERE
jgi:hypothetical protein